MYIIAIGWLWVTLMMAITEPNVVAGVLTFTFYGLLPCSLLMWLMGTPARRRAAARKTREESGVAGNQLADAPDRKDAQGNQ